MISVTFTSDIENITCDTHVYQWDSGRTLEIKGLTFSDTPAVHFANKMSKNAFAVEPTLANGILIVNIPNSLLCEPHNIVAYVYCLDNNQCKTIKTVFIPLEKITKPADYIFEGDEGIFTMSEINAKVDELIATTNAHYDSYVQAKNVELNGFMNDKTTQINNFIASQNADREAYQNQLNAQFESFQNNVASSHNHNNLYYGKSEVDAKLSEKASLEDLENVGSVTGVTTHTNGADTTINLGFKPKAVFVEGRDGQRYVSTSRFYGGFALDGYPQVESYISSGQPYSYTILSITDTGFMIHSYMQGGTKYYIAFK